MNGPYWESRKRLRYYQVAIDLAQKHAPHGTSVLDVGSRDCQYIMRLDTFPVKHAIDLKRTPTATGVLGLKMDFMQFVPGRFYDVVFCLQVLEHVAEPRAFCAKLMAVGRCVIVSVPYRWHKGTCSTHVHDPMDEGDLLLWAGRLWQEMRIVKDGRLRRMVAVFSSEAALRETQLSGALLRRTA